MSDFKDLLAEEYNLERENLTFEDIASHILSTGKNI